MLFAKNEIIFNRSRGDQRVVFENRTSVSTFACFAKKICITSRVRHRDLLGRGGGEKKGRGGMKRPCRQSAYVRDGALGKGANEGNERESEMNEVLSDLVCTHNSTGRICSDVCMSISFRT